MGIAHEVLRKVGQALRPLHAGERKLAVAKLGSEGNQTLHVTSSAFPADGALPLSATAQGGNTAPPIAWKGVPEHAQSVVVVCEDPDAPFPQPYVHWLVYDLPPVDGEVGPALYADARAGENSKGDLGFTGAAPPPGHGVHHYHFQVFALDVSLGLEQGAGRGALFEAMRGHVLAWGQVVGTWESR